LISSDIGATGEKAMPNDYEMTPKIEFTAMEEQAMRDTARRARQASDPDFIARTARQVASAPFGVKPKPYDE
jgi:hypothetical protein